MKEEIYNWLENNGWSWQDNYHTKEIQSYSGEMIINGQRIQGPPVITKFKITYLGDGWIENADGSNHIDTTDWRIDIERGQDWQYFSVSIDSLSQFQEIMKEII